MSRAQQTAMMRRWERALVRLDQPQWAALPRIVFGYVLIPAQSWVTGNESISWTLIVFFVAVLAAVRLTTAVVREVLPFSAKLQETWAARRRLARRFDSYQWQKLFGIGLGLALHVAS